MADTPVSNSSTTASIPGMDVESGSPKTRKASSVSSGSTISANPAKKKASPAPAAPRTNANNSQKRAPAGPGSSQKTRPQAASPGKPQRVKAAQPASQASSTGIRPAKKPIAGPQNQQRGATPPASVNARGPPPTNSQKPATKRASAPTRTAPGPKTRKPGPNSSDQSENEKNTAPVPQKRRPPPQTKPAPNAAINGQNGNPNNVPKPVSPMKGPRKTNQRAAASKPASQTSATAAAAASPQQEVAPQKRQSPKALNNRPKEGPSNPKLSSPKKGPSRSTAAQASLKQASNQQAAPLDASSSSPRRGLKGRKSAQQSAGAPGQAQASRKSAPQPSIQNPAVQSPAPRPPPPATQTGAVASKGPMPRKTRRTTPVATMSASSTTTRKNIIQAEPTQMAAPGAHHAASGPLPSKGRRATVSADNNRNTPVSARPGAQASITGPLASKGRRHTTAFPRNTAAARSLSPGPGNGTAIIKPGAVAATGTHGSTTKGLRYRRQTRTTGDIMTPGAHMAQGGSKQQPIQRSRSTDGVVSTNAAPGTHEPGRVAQRERQRGDDNRQRTQSLNQAAAVGAMDPARRKQARLKSRSRSPVPVEERPPNKSSLAFHATGSAPPPDAGTTRPGAQSENSRYVAAKSTLGLGYNAQQEENREEEDAASQEVEKMADDGDGENRGSALAGNSTIPNDDDDPSESDKNQNGNLIEAVLVEEQSNNNQVPIIVQAAVGVDDDKEAADKRRLYMFIVLVVCCAVVFVVVAIVVAVVVLTKNSSSHEDKALQNPQPILTFSPEPSQEEVGSGDPEAEAAVVLLPDYDERDQYFDWFYQMAWETIFSDEKEELLDGDTPYKRALDWIVYSDLMQLQPDDEDHSRARQRYVMAVLYESMSEDNEWISCNPPNHKEDMGEFASICQHQVLSLEGSEVHSATYEEEEAARWLSGKSECSWAGVECSKSGDSVIRIKLGGYEMSGMIPPEIGWLTTLKLLDFEHNNLGWGLPPEIGELTELTDLSVRLNDLELDIPESICELELLEKLFLSSNRFSGIIPDCLGQLTNMLVLNLNGNALTGKVPVDLERMTRLQHLRIQGNDLTGEVPRGVCQLDLKAATADCLRRPGNDPKIQCPCCTTCCDESGSCTRVEARPDQPP